MPAWWWWWWWSLMEHVNAATCMQCVAVLAYIIVVCVLGREKKREAS